MRRVIEDTFQPRRGARTIPREHMGLAYVMYAPIGPDGKIPDDQREDWFKQLEEEFKWPQGYEHAYERWRDALMLDSSFAVEGTLASRLFVGHGEASPTDVGLTFHHTWGVPVIPGSALKGLLSHYIQASYGPSDQRAHPSDAAHAEPERAAWQGVTWDGSKIKHGPGEAYRVIFGAPDAMSDDDYEGSEAAQGHVIFHDAWILPEGEPFVRDIVTPHQRSYYQSSGAQPPTDHDDPNPVGFLNVRPGCRFLIAVSGPPEWAKLALELLQEALTSWGVGAKTTSGYGRFKSNDWRKLKLGIARAKQSELVQEIADWFKAPSTEALSARDRMDSFDTTWTTRIDAEADSEPLKVAIWESVKAAIPKNKKTQDWLSGWSSKLKP